MTTFQETLEYKEMQRKNAKNLKRIADALEKIAEGLGQPLVMTFKQPNLGDEGLCGNDDPDIPEKAGPCILLRGHADRDWDGGHKDKAGGEW